MNNPHPKPLDRESRKEGCRRLWEQCFSDSEAFTDLYFRHRYRDDRTLTLRRGGRVVSAMQLLPYPLAFCGEVVPMAYVSGACTQPDHRGRGLMTGLLTRALRRMRREGVAVATLIPAEPWLWDFYARVGFARAFDRGWCEELPSGDGADADPAVAVEVDGPQPATASSGEARPVGTDGGDGGEVVLEEADSPASVAEACDFLYRRGVARPCYVLHPEADLRVVAQAIGLWGGRIWLLRRGGRLKAVAVGAPTDRGGQKVIELDVLENMSAADREAVLKGISLASGVDRIVMPTADRGACRPFAMARIVDAPRLLALYARANPDCSMDFHLVDGQLPEQSGHYSLRSGRCTFTPCAVPAGAVDGSVGMAVAGGEVLTPEALARRVFLSLEGEMSLMLN